MDTSTYDVEAQVEAGHWWFVGRRKLIADALARHRLAPDLRVLDIGTSTGTNLRLLRDLGFRDRTGLDPSADAIRWCAEKGLGKVIQGDVCALPFDDGAFDLVFATDVIEHVDDDARAMSEIQRVLAPVDNIIVTVPGFPFLRGLLDFVGYRWRSHRVAEVTRVAKISGMRWLETYRSTSPALAPTRLARQFICSCRRPLKCESEVDCSWINRVLTWVYGDDAARARLVRPPFGLSIQSIATIRLPT